jgi:dipeptidyl aminopeptidase/acylaminoacyl peptidase
MKKIVLIGTVASLAMAAGNAVADTAVTDWNVTSVKVKAPFMNDSISPKGEKYKPTELLSSRMAKHQKNVVEVKADTAGTIALEMAEQDGLLHVLSTQIRAERFAKGQIKVTSQAPFAILLDDKELAKKEGVQRDSVTRESERTANVRLEPERDYNLVVRILSQTADSVKPTVKVVFVPDKGFDSIQVYSGANLKRRFSIDDSEYGYRIDRVSVSPDGKYLLTKYYDYEDAKHNRYYATLTDLKTMKVINEDVNAYAEWMPTGSTLYTTYKMKDGVDVTITDAKTGKELARYDCVPTNTFTWSPDGKYIIYSKTDEGIKESGPLRRYASPEDRIPGFRSRTWLMKYDPETGLSQQLTFGNHSTDLRDISADGTKILVNTQNEKSTVRPFIESTIYELDLNTMKADTIVPTGPQFITGAYYSPDGKKVLLTGSAAAFDKIGQKTGNEPIANDYDIQMFILDRATGNVEAITRDFDPCIDTYVTWNKGDGKIYFTAQDGFYLPVYVYDPKAKTFDKLPTQVDVTRTASIAAYNPTVVAYNGQGYNYAGRGYVLDLKTKKNTLIGDPSAERFANIELGKSEPWKFTASDGTVIDGNIIYPPHFDENKTYPAIIYYYGGTLPTQRTITHAYSPQLFASRDYVVYVLNPSGTTGYGQEFAARHVNAWGNYTANDIIEGVTKFAEEHPFVNKEKIGCIGASYGGFMTQYLQTLTPLFAAAVSHAGISNVTSYWGEGYWGYSYSAVAAADSYPWNNPELYTKHGSLFNADKINTPLLLLHGTADTNVPIGESIQLFNALKVLNKTVEFVSVDGENHYIMDFPKRILWQNTIMAWFAKWLQDSPEWWNDLYPDRKM